MRKWFFILLLLCLPAVSLFAQNKITGQVIGEDGIPVAGLTVMVQGTTNGVITDNEGKYSISCKNDDSLVFTMLGMEEQVIRVDNRKSINVVMRPEQTSLDEVVVVAYGTEKKSDLTGAVGVVNMDKVKSDASLSVDQMLQGRVAGMEITSAGGEPGEGMSIRVRGTRSINASNDPLIVLDGVVDAVDSFSDINPEDIKSVSVLKDASSTALYGSRGANGVILVTTKGGDSQTLNITFSAKVGLAELPRKMDVMNAAEFAQYRNDFNFDRGTFSLTTAQSSDVQGTKIYPYENPASFGKGTDWQDVMTRKAVNQSYNFTLNTGESRSHIYFSLGYDDTQGIIIGNDQKRLVSRIKVDRRLYRWVKIGANVQFNYRFRDRNKIQLNGTSTSAAVCISPLLDPTSTWNKYADTGTNGGSVYDNPYIVATSSTYWVREYYLQLNPWVEWTLTKNNRLKMRNSFSYKYNVYQDFKYEPSTLPVSSTRLTGAYAMRANDERNSFLWENTINYDRTFNGGHKLQLMGGFTMQGRWINYTALSGTGYLDDTVTFYNMESVMDRRNLSPSTNRSLMKRMSFIARANYSALGRYYLTFTGRYDGASNFAEKHKWAFFPAAAFRWNISKEPWLAVANATWLTDLSLRLSAGMTGNDAVSTGVSRATLSNSASGWMFGELSPVAYYPSRLDNPNLTWEKTTSYNVGLDVSLWRDRISMTLDGYLSYTTDLLMSVANAAHTGYTSRWKNFGKTRNMGIEFSITSHNITRKHFNWETTFNISHNDQIVLDIGDTEYISTVHYDGQMYYGYVKGYPANALWGFKCAGVWHNDEERERNKATHAFVSRYDKNGVRKYVDINHDGVLDRNDYVYMGSGDPVVYGGLQNSFNFWNVHLDLFLSYSLGGKLYNISERQLGMTTYTTNKYRYMLDGWHPVRNPWSDIPAPYDEDTYGSDFLIHDASFLRIKTLSVGYTFDLRNKVKWMKSIDLSLSGDNLWLFTTYNGYDPDISSSGRRIDNASYPNPRTYTLSIKAKF